MATIQSGTKMPAALILKFKMLCDFTRTPYAMPQWATRQGQVRPTRRELRELTRSTWLEF